ncbi:ComF family protein [Aquisalimonas asiatica]|uniref:ComF family protein n=1 Tax=Aquisalimonas asiatica TaxID=406100 RepID=A0A1H8TJL7_9GAMM|nr:ComF family protein [Aquisalimonas asiatica]SEO91172.1 comF family protein [Aquisalimonas asiatica]
MDSVYRITQWIAAALLPPTCLCCGRPGAAGLDLCAGCYRDLPRNRHACHGCAAPVAAGVHLCGHCQTHADHCNAVIAPWRYEAPIDGLIQALKFHGQLPAGQLLGALLARELVQRHPPTVDAIIPMPAHPRRLRERGFNQAAEIARAISAATGIPVRHHWLLRRRHTRPQTGLGRTHRERNLLGAFTAHPAVAGCRLALVDDVVTTGSTSTEAAQALKRAGASDVVTWAVARAALQL